MGTPHILAVKASLGLDAVGGSCFVAPGSSVSVQNMKATNTIHTVCCNGIQSHEKHTKPQIVSYPARPFSPSTKPDRRWMRNGLRIRQKPVTDCSPGVSLERNQTRCSSVRVLQNLAGFKVQVISVRVLSTTEA